MSPRPSPLTHFDNAQRFFRSDPKGGKLLRAIQSLYNDCSAYLATKPTQKLTTELAGKSYFSFVNGNEPSRPVNAEIYEPGRVIDWFFDAVEQKVIRTDLLSKDITRSCYTIVSTIACAVDLANPGDKKTPGTLYEYLVTHLISRTSATIQDRIRVPVGVGNISLTMDLIAQMDSNRPQLHIAVKNSTRERASEIWTHQRILDSAFGVGKFIGLFVGLAETKLDRQSLKVVEICVPDQWRAYQEYVARISGFYYLDPPAAYLALNNKQPEMSVKPFGDLFFDGWLLPDP